MHSTKRTHRILCHKSSIVATLQAFDYFYFFLLFIVYAYLFIVIIIMVDCNGIRKLVVLVQF
jgi:hypothetical protein